MGPSLSAGSVTPADDFQAVVDYCTSVALTPAEQDRLRLEITRSIEVLEKIIALLITMGGTSAHFRKAVGCIKVLCTLCGSLELLPKIS